MITLPTKKVPASRINPRILLLYGPPKIGKTTLAAELENNLILDIEDGTAELDALKISCKNWNELKKYGDEIIAQGKPYKYITLDTATELEDWCDGLGKSLYLNAPMAKKEYKNNPDLLASITVLPGQEGAYGPGYQWLRIAYGMCFNYLLTLADHLILIAHIKDSALVDKKGDEIKGGSVSSKNLDLTGKLKAITCSKASAIGLLYRKVTGAENGVATSEIWVNFSGLEVMAGTRNKHLINKDMKFEWNKIFLPNKD